MYRAADGTIIYCFIALTGGTIMIARLQAMTCTATVLLLSAISAFSQEKLVDFDRIYPDEFHVQGFVLDKDQDIQIDAAGLYLSDGRDESLFVGYGWIIDAQTREVVWAFAPDEFSNDRPETMQKSESVLLPKVHMKPVTLPIHTTSAMAIGAIPPTTGIVASWVVCSTVFLIVAIDSAIILATT